MHEAITSTLLFTIGQFLSILLAAYRREETILQVCWLDFRKYRTIATFGFLITAAVYADMYSVFKNLSMFLQLPFIEVGHISFSYMADDILTRLDELYHRKRNGK